jgi:hypothetical protein
LLKKATELKIDAYFAYISRTHPTILAMWLEVVFLANKYCILINMYPFVLFQNG